MWRLICNPPGYHSLECSGGSSISWGRGHQLLNFRHKPIIWQDFCRKLPDFQMTEIGPGAGVPSPPPGSTANGMFKFPFYNSRFLRQECSSVIVIDSDWLIDYLIVFSSRLLLMSYNLIRLITARNEVRARLCFHRRVWFCSQRRGVCLSACWDATPPLGSRHPPGADTPPGSNHHPPWEQTPPPGADTPMKQTPLPGSRHAPEQTHTPGADPPQHRACWEIWSTRGQYASYWNAILFRSLLMTILTDWLMDGWHLAEINP